MPEQRRQGQEPAGCVQPQSRETSQAGLQRVQVSIQCVDALAAMMRRRQNLLLLWRGAAKSQKNRVVLKYCEPTIRFKSNK
jgi:hypothetical protein